MFIRPIYEPYELSYYEERDLNEKLNMRIVNLEEELHYCREEVKSWEELFKRKIPVEKQDDKFWLICNISKLQYLLDKLEELNSLNA